MLPSFNTLFQPSQAGEPEPPPPAYLQQQQQQQQQQADNDWWNSPDNDHNPNAMSAAPHHDSNVMNFDQRHSSLAQTVTESMSLYDSDLKLHNGELLVSNPLDPDCDKQFNFIESLDGSRRHIRSEFPELDRTQEEEILRRVFTSKSLSIPNNLPNNAVKPVPRPRQRRGRQAVSAVRAQRPRFPGPEFNPGYSNGMFVPPEVAWPRAEFEHRLPQRFPQHYIQEPRYNGHYGMMPPRQIPPQFHRPQVGYAPVRGYQYQPFPPPDFPGRGPDFPGQNPAFQNAYSPSYPQNGQYVQTPDGKFYPPPDLHRNMPVERRYSLTTDPKYSPDCPPELNPAMANPYFCNNSIEHPLDQNGMRVEVTRSPEGSNEVTLSLGDECSSSISDENFDLLRRLKENLPEMPSCQCTVKNGEILDQSPYYTQLGAAPSVADLRTMIEKRFGESGGAIRIEKISYTGKEGKTSQGCPMAKWIIRRSSPDEKVLVLLKERRGHYCQWRVIVVCIVAWDGVNREQADDLYAYMTSHLPVHGVATERRCGTNEQKTCACQGFNENDGGASFSFGCSWSMFYNGCKFARSRSPKKFRFKTDEEEPVIEAKLQKLADDMAPLYERLAPFGYENQCKFDDVAFDCRLGTKPGRPFSGITACVDYCAHAHKDLHNMNNGCTVVVTLAKHRDSTRPADEQLHVLPLYTLEPSDDLAPFRTKVESGAIEILTSYPTITRIRAHPRTPKRKNCKKKDDSSPKKELKSPRKARNGSVEASPGKVNGIRKSVDSDSFDGFKSPPIRTDLLSPLVGSETSVDNNKALVLNHDHGVMTKVKEESMSPAKTFLVKTEPSNSMETAESRVGDIQNMVLDKLSRGQIQSSTNTSPFAEGNELCPKVETTTIRRQGTSGSCKESEVMDRKLQANGGESLKWLKREPSLDSMGETESIPNSNDEDDLSSIEPSLVTLNEWKQQGGELTTDSDSQRANQTYLDELLEVSEQKGKMNYLDSLQRIIDSDATGQQQQQQVALLNSATSMTTGDATSQFAYNNNNANSMTSNNNNNSTIHSSNPAVEFGCITSRHHPPSHPPSQAAHHPHHPHQYLPGFNGPPHSSHVMYARQQLRYHNPGMNTMQSHQQHHHHQQQQQYSNSSNSGNHCLDVNRPPRAEIIRISNPFDDDFTPNVRLMPELPIVATTPPIRTPESNGRPAFPSPPVFPVNAKFEPQGPPSKTEVKKATKVLKVDKDEEFFCTNEENFQDSSIGGVAIALSHGSVLFEVAKRELHATTALKTPNRKDPTRISLVFYQHKNLNYANHGWSEWEAKMEQRRVAKEKAKQEAELSKQEAEMTSFVEDPRGLPAIVESGELHQDTKYHLAQL